MQEPARPGGADAIRGPRLFKMPAAAVTWATGRLRDAEFAARRTAHGWSLAGVAPSAGIDAAVEDLVDLLTGLRAVDAFRAGDTVQFGLAVPQARVTLVAARRDTTLDLGDFNASGSAVYARRSGDPRIFQVGSLVLSAVERVLYQQRLARESAGTGAAAD